MATASLSSQQEGLRINHLILKNDIDKAYKSGANYFIVKPNAIENIADLIKKLCSMGKEVLLSIPPREEFVII